MSDSPTRRLPIVLIASLVLNGLLIGLLIGGGLSKRGHAPPQMGAERALLRGLERATPQAEQAEVRQALRQAFIASRAERRTVHQARRNLRQAVTADPYDESTVREALKAIQGAETEARAKLQDEVARQLGRLTLEQRQDIMRNLERRPSPRSKHGPRFERQPRPPQE